MTKGNISGGTAVVNRSLSPLKKEVRRSTRGTVVEEHLEDMALVKAEENLISPDEEITSVEDNVSGRDTSAVEESAVEEALVTVAIVNSVVEANSDPSGRKGRVLDSSVVDSGDGGGTSTKDAVASDGDRVRYGLRKRRRTAGSALERLEHFQSSKDGGLARTNCTPMNPTGPSAPPPPLAVEGSSAPLAPGLSKSLSSPTRIDRPLSTSASEKLRSSTPNSGSVQAPILVPVPVPVVLPISVPSALVGITPDRPSSSRSSSVPISTLLPQKLENSPVPCPPPEPTQDANNQSTNKDQRRVKISDPNQTDRIRGFSMDMDCKLSVKARASLAIIGIILTISSLFV